MVEKKLDFTQLHTKISPVRDLKSFEHFLFVSNVWLIKSSSHYINRKEISAGLHENPAINSHNQRLAFINVATLETSGFINIQEKALNLLKINRSIHVSSIYDSHLKTLAFNDIKTAPKIKSVFLS